MKTRIATLCFMLGIFLASTTFAGATPVASKDARKEVTKIIKKEVKYPAFAKAKNFQCCVKVSIVIQEDGTMNVDCANCIDQRMKEYVVKAIENHQSDKLKDYAGQNVLVKIKFNMLQI